MPPPPEAAYDAQTVIQTYGEFLQPNYGRLPVVFDRGEGCYLYDVAGRSHLDWVSGGRAGCALGHCHPRLTRAITEQAGRLTYLSNDYHHPWAAELGRLVAEKSYGYLSFFCNSGAEASEAAIKLARKWGRGKRGESCHNILTFEGSFHGRTLGALAATAQPQYQADFRPMPAGFTYLPWCDETALEAAVSSDVCAIYLEPVLGETGIFPATATFMQTIQQLCAANDILFMVDEVQTGFGRTGAFWAHEHYEVQPDVITTAKAIGGGLPLGAMIASPEAAVLKPGDHGCTFGGNPLSTRAAVEAMRVLEDESLIENAQIQGGRLRDGLEAIASETGVVAALRGLGLMQAIEFRSDIGAAVSRACLQGGLLVHSVGERTLRILPPIVITGNQIDEGLGLLREAIAETVA